MLRVILMLFAVMFVYGEAKAWTLANSNEVGSTYYDETSVQKAGRKVSFRMRQDSRSGSPAPREYNVIMDCELATFQIAFPSGGGMVDEVLNDPNVKAIFSVLCEQEQSTSDKPKKKQAK